MTLTRPIKEANKLSIDECPARRLTVLLSTAIGENYQEAEKDFGDVSQMNKLF
jgi:hypothetical protein